VFQVFGRTSSTQHPLEHSLRAILERQDAYTAGDRAVAFNVMDDHRVSPDREREFLRCAGATPDSRGLKDGLVEYFKDEIRFSLAPAFLAISNQNNRIPITLGDPEHPGLHPGLDLGRVLSLSGLEPVFKRNVTRLPHEFRDVGDSDADAHFEDWLSEKCNASDAAKERLVEAILDMLNEDRKSNPYEPAWAARWEDFEPLVAEGATRWRQALGRKPEPRPAWLIVLKYKVSEARQPYRPTQLDGDWYEFHFPSPRQLPLEDGGLAMDLAANATHVVREIIHPQVNHYIKHWTDGGRKMGLAQMDDSINLEVQRQAHHDLRVDKCGEDAQLWRF
jgi:hypothetical protein